MRRNVFNEYIENRQFREMFIMEMGWNNVHGNAQLPTSLSRSEIIVKE